MNIKKTSADNAIAEIAKAVVDAVRQDRLPLALITYGLDERVYTYAREDVDEELYRELFARLGAARNKGGENAQT